MKTKSKKVDKLILRRETVVALGDRALLDVAGGTCCDRPTGSAATGCCHNC